MDNHSLSNIGQGIFLMVIKFFTHFICASTRVSSYVEYKVWTSRPMYIKKNYLYGTRWFLQVLMFSYSSSHDPFSGTPLPQSSSTPFPATHTVGRPRDVLWSATPLDRHSVARSAGGTSEQDSEFVLCYFMILVVIILLQLSNAHTPSK